MSWPFPEPVVRPQISPFNWLLWGFVLLLLLLSSGMLTIIFWPEGVLARGARFWLLATGLPCLAFSFLLGLHLERRAAVWRRYEAEEHEHQRLTSLWNTWANRRVAILAAAAFVPVATDVKRWYTNAKALPINTDRAISLRLTSPEAGKPPLAHLFGLLVERFKAVLENLGESFDVLLELDKESHHAYDSIACKQFFEKTLSTITAASVECFDTVLHRPSGATISDWIDHPRTRPLLFITARFWQEETGEWSEGAAAFLIGTQKQGSRSDVQTGSEAIAWLYRPMSSTLDDLTGDVAQLATVQSEAPLKHLWHTGFDHTMQKKLHEAAAAPYVVLLHDEQSGEHQLDDVLGKPSEVSGWVATAFAVNGASAKFGDQLVLSLEAGAEKTCTSLLVRETGLEIRT